MSTRKITSLGLVLACLVILSCNKSSPTGGAAAKTASPTGLAIGLGAKTSDLSPAASTFNENPIMSDGPSAMSTSGVSDVYGTLSVENFSGTQRNLTWTHDSAQGFRDYLRTWYTANFVYQDGGVAAWQFHDVSGGDNWDLWTSGGTDYGIDGVLAAWHSSHGGMGADGTFFTSLGADWAGRGWNAMSNRMSLGGNAGRFGDERLRYIFWDTCFGVRIFDGHNPYRTWGARANGVRMIFGYETVSSDNPNYGRFFWEEYARGKANSWAFLDASWRINTNQVPVAVAFGATAAEASSRLDGERGLHWGAVSNAYAAWRWYYARAAADAPSAMSSPTRVMSYRPVVTGNSDETVADIARSIGINATADSVQTRPYGIRVVETKGATLSVEPDGDFEIILKSDSPRAAAVSAADADLVNRAQGLVKQFNLDAGQQLVASKVLDVNESVASAQNPEGSAPQTIRKTVILTQTVNGLPFIDPDAGHVAVTFAGNGEAERVRSTIRKIDGTTAASQGVSASARTLQDARQLALNSVANPPAPNVTPEANTMQVMNGTEAVGYQMIDGKATPVYRALLQDPKFPNARPTEVIIPLALPAGGGTSQASAQ